MFLKTKLKEALTGNSFLKKKYLVKLMQIKEMSDLCHIYRIRNTNTKWYTFCQQHNWDYIPRRLDYFLISTDLKEFIKKSDDLAVFSTYYSLITFSL